MSFAFCLFALPAYRPARCFCLVTGPGTERRAFSKGFFRSVGLRCRPNPAARPAFGAAWINPERSRRRGASAWRFWLWKSGCIRNARVVVAATRPAGAWACCSRDIAEQNPPARAGVWAAGSPAAHGCARSGSWPPDSGSQSNGPVAGCVARPAP